MNGIWAYLSNFSRVWTFIGKLGSGSGSGWGYRTEQVRTVRYFNFDSFVFFYTLIWLLYSRVPAFLIWNRFAPIFTVTQMWKNLCLGSAIILCKSGIRICTLSSCESGLETFRLWWIWTGQPSNLQIWHQVFLTLKGLHQKFLKQLFLDPLKWSVYRPILLLIRMYSRSEALE